MDTFQIATAELGDRDGLQYETEAKGTQGEDRLPFDWSLLEDLPETSTKTVIAPPSNPVSVGAEEVGFWFGSEYYNIEPTQFVLVAVAALLVSWATIYHVAKRLRTRKGRLIGLAVIGAAVLAVGWARRAQEDRERVEKIWRETFRDTSIKDFDSCVAARTVRIYSEHYRIKLVNECGEIAKAIKQGIEAH